MDLIVLSDHDFAHVFDRLIPKTSSTYNADLRSRILAPNPCRIGIEPESRFAESRTSSDHTIDVISRRNVVAYLGNVVGMYVGLRINNVDCEMRR